MAHYVYCDWCGREFDECWKKVGKQINLSHPTIVKGGNLFTNVEIVVEVKNKDDICMVCRLEAAQNALDELKEYYGNEKEWE